jgi:hypothetical protein
LRVRAAADDPVEPQVVSVGRAGDELRVTLPQPGDRARLAADELMEPFIAQHSGHLLGVLDPQRRQVGACRDDRGAVVEWA